MTTHKRELLVGAADVLCLWQSEDVVEFGNELLDGRDELDDAFRNEHCTKVVAFSSTCSHSFSDVSHYVVERHGLGFHFL